MIRSLIIGDQHFALAEAFTITSYANHGNVVGGYYVPCLMLNTSGELEEGRKHYDVFNGPIRVSSTFTLGDFGSCRLVWAGNISNAVFYDACLVTDNQWQKWVQIVHIN